MAVLADGGTALCRNALRRALIRVIDAGHGGAHAGRLCGRHAEHPRRSQSRLATLVGHFYDKVRADPLLGVVFNPVVADWDAHKVLMTLFWATVVLRTGYYRGNPLAKHQPLPIGGEHFQAGWIFGGRPPVSCSIGNLQHW